MKTFITALALVFVLASGTSMMTLTVHADRTHTDQDRSENGPCLLNPEYRSADIAAPFKGSGMTAFDESCRRYGHVLTARFDLSGHRVHTLSIRGLLRHLTIAP
jgi:hypothetical protein